MGKLILDPILSSKLNGLNEAMEICDEKGLTVGHFLPEEDYRKMLYAAVEASCPLSAQELAGRQQEVGGSSLANIWKRLGRS